MWAQGRTEARVLEGLLEEGEAMDWIKAGTQEHWRFGGGAHKKIWSTVRTLGGSRGSALMLSIVW